MSLADRTPSLDTIPARCKVGILFAGHSPAEHDTLLRWHAEGAPSTSILREVNAEFGTALGIDSMRRHLKGECRCAAV